MHNEEHKEGHDGGDMIKAGLVGAAVGAVAVAAGAAFLASDAGQKFLQDSEEKLNELKEKFEVVRTDVEEAVAEKFEATRDDIAAKIKEARELGHDKGEEFVAMLQGRLDDLQASLDEAETKSKAKKAA